MRDINEIKDLIEKAESEEEVNSIVRECGFAIDGSSRELSDDELDNVNGGVDMQAFANIIAKFALEKINAIIANTTMSTAENKEKTILDQTKSKDIL